MKPNIEGNSLANNEFEQPLQEEELANKEDRKSQKDGRILTDPPLVEIKSLQVEVIDSKSNESTHPHPPISALPPSPSPPEPPPVFIKVGRTIFRRGEGKAPAMIPYDGELPPGAVVHEGKVPEGY
jgi:hypothetical protein